MHVRLLIDRIPPPDTAGERHPLLETLLARGRRSKGHWRSAAHWLFGEFGLDADEAPPTAPFALRGDGGSPGDAFWVHADPVHLAAGSTQVGVTGAGALAITRIEAEGLAEAINTHFGARLQVFPLRPDRWYARMDAPPEGSVAPLAKVLAHGIDISGGQPSALAWHALMNEIQMLLFEHPVNLDREQRGAPPVNGVWLSGGGRETAADGRGLRAMFSDSALAAGLATAAGLRTHPLPVQAQTLLDDAGEGVALALLDWVDARTLERDWMQALVQALRAGRIGMLTLHLAAGDMLLSVETTQGDLRRFWRRRKPLHAWLPREDEGDAR